MDQTILAYTAGLIDGEGCICIARCKPCGNFATARYRLNVQIGMTDEGIVRWIGATFGGTVHSKSFKGVRRTAYTCTFFCRKAAAFLELIQPYIRVKQEQVALALEFQKSVSAFAPSVKGRRLTDDELSRRRRFYEGMHALNLHSHRPLPVESAPP